MHFLAVLTKCVVSNPYLKDPSKREFYWMRECRLYFFSWLSIRGLCLKQILLVEGYRLSRSERLILSQMKSLEHLEAPFGALFKVLELCPTVFELIISGLGLKLDDNAVLSLLPKLENLTSLKIYDAQINRGSFEAMSRCLPDVTTFQCTDKNADAIISRCKWLETVACDCNLSSLASLLELDNLTSLSLHEEVDGHEFEKAIQKVLERFRGLRHLSLQRIFLNDAVLLRMAECCRYLTTLKIFGGSDEVLTALSTKCTLLTSVCITSLEITDAGLSELVRGCSKLTELSVISGEISDHGALAVLLHCKNLTSLQLVGDEISDFPFLRLFETLPSLIVWTTVDMLRTTGDSTNITCRVLAANIRNVEYLSISTTNISGIEFSANVSAVKRRIEYWEEDQDENNVLISLKTIFLQCPLLRDVHLENSAVFNDDCMECLVVNCPLLTSISVVGCDNLTELTFSLIHKHALRVEKLRVYGIEAGDSDILPLVQARPNLRKLWLYHNDITDAVVDAIGSHCFGMRSVELCCSSRITEGAVLRLLQQCKRLTFLDVRNCMQLDGRALVDGIVSMKRRLTYLGVGNYPDTCSEMDELLVSIDSDLIDASFCG